MKKKGKVKSWSQTIREHTRILRTEIHSCFKCDHIDFYVDPIRRTVYKMTCTKGGFTWEDKSDSIDYRPDGLIPENCPLERPKFWEGRR